MAILYQVVSEVVQNASGFAKLQVSAWMLSRVLPLILAISFSSHVIYCDQTESASRDYSVYDANLVAAASCLISLQIDASVLLEKSNALYSDPDDALTYLKDVISNKAKSGVRCDIVQSKQISNIIDRLDTDDLAVLSFSGGNIDSKWILRTFQKTKDGFRLIDGPFLKAHNISLEEMLTVGAKRYIGSALIVTRQLHQKGESDSDIVVNHRVGENGNNKKYHVDSIDKENSEKTMIWTQSLTLVNVPLGKNKLYSDIVIKNQGANAIDIKKFVGSCSCFQRVEGDLSIPAFSEEKYRIFLDIEGKVLNPAAGFQTQVIFILNGSDVPYKIDIQITFDLDKYCFFDPVKLLFDSQSYSRLQPQHIKVGLFSKSALTKMIIKEIVPPDSVKVSLVSDNQTSRIGDFIKSQEFDITPNLKNMQSGVNRGHILFYDETNNVDATLPWSITLN